MWRDDVTPSFPIIPIFLILFMTLFLCVCFEPSHFSSSNSRDSGYLVDATSPTVVDGSI